MLKLTKRQEKFIKMLGISERTVKRNLKLGHLNIKIMEELHILRQEMAISNYVKSHSFTDSELEKARQAIRYNGLNGFTPETYIAYTVIKGQ